MWPVAISLARAVGIEGVHAFKQLCKPALEAAKCEFTGNELAVAMYHCENRRSAEAKERIVDFLRSYPFFFECVEPGSRLERAVDDRFRLWATAYDGLKLKAMIFASQKQYREYLYGERASAYWAKSEMKRAHSAYRAFMLWIAAL